MGNYVLHDPLWLLALLAIPLVVWLRQRQRVRVLVVPFAAAWHRPSLAAASRWPGGLAIAGLVLLIGALARPQRVEDKREVRTEGYDLMLVLDVSGSMLWEDYPRPGVGPNRIRTLKPIVQAFVTQRPHDRIGVVLFGRRAYTLAPLTFDHDWIAEQLSRIEIGMVDPAGTVIGDGLGTALNRLEQQDRMAQGRRRGAFIILLTDGGESKHEDGTPLSVLPPLQGAELAKARGIPIYCVGVGSPGYVWEPIVDNGKIVDYRRRVSDLDENLLHDLANATGGQVFRATDKDTAEHAFAAIDQAQKIEFQSKSFLVTTELFPWLAVPGAAFVLAGTAAVLLAARRRRRPTGLPAAIAPHSAPSS